MTCPTDRMNRVLRLTLLILMALCCSVSWAQAGVQQGETPDFFARGNQFYDQGKYREAVKQYRAAILSDQIVPFAWFNMGNSLVHLKMYPLALVAYRRSLELAPDFVRSWVLLGDLYFIHNDIGLALAAYRRALDLGESGEHLYYAMAECYRKGHEFALAQKYYEKVLQKNPDRIEVWVSLAEMAEELKDYDEALERLQQAILLSPSAGADVFFYMAYLNLENDRVHMAIRNLEDGLVLAPDHVMARRHLAQLYQEQDSPWMSIFTLKQGLTTVSESDRAQLWVDLGQIYFAQDRHQEALDAFLAAWKLGSAQGRIGAENVAATWYNQNMTEQAEDAWKRIRNR